MKLLEEQYGYQCFWHTFPYNRAANYFGANDESLFKGMVSINVVCLEMGAKVPAAILALPPYENVWTDRLCSGNATYCTGNERMINKMAIAGGRISSLQAEGQGGGCTQDRRWHGGDALLEEPLILTEIQLTTDTRVVSLRSKQWVGKRSYQYTRAVAADGTTEQRYSADVARMEDFCCAVCSQVDECNCFTFKEIALTLTPKAGVSSARTWVGGECVPRTRCAYQQVR
jgi:hypothetical protein